jgi:hypothetical protein
MALIANKRVRWQQQEYQQDLLANFLLPIHLIHCVVVLDVKTELASQ